MSFKISKVKLKDRDPIARIRGGADDKSYLYYTDQKYSIKDIPNDMIKHLKENEMKELDEALCSGFEPHDEHITKLFYNCKNFIKKRNCKLLLKSGGKFEYIPSLKVIERCLICGISGSGKSTWASNYIKQWRKQHGGNSKNRRPFYIVSNLDDDEVLDKLDPERIPLDKIAHEGVSVEKDDEDSLYDSLLLCDDIDTIENSGIRKAVRGFLNNMLEISRHYQTYILITSHVIQNNYVSRVQLNECTNMILFPKSNARAVSNYLKTYEYFNDEQVQRVLNCNSRWVMLCKHHTPMYILTERMVYIV